MEESQRPTWEQIAGNAIQALDAAYSHLSDARDWLQSDWKPRSLRPQDHPEVRHDVYKLIEDAKVSIEKAKRALYTED